MSEDINIVTLTKEIINHEETIGCIADALVNTNRGLLKLNKSVCVYGVCIIISACIGIAQNKRITKLESKVNNMKG